MAGSTGNPRQVVGKRRSYQRMQERGNTRRRQLLEATEQMLETTPIEELSFKRVSERAGVPEGSAYHFFANRYDLLTALAAMLAGRFIERYREAIASSGIDGWQDLVDVFVDRAVAIYRENPAAMKIWLSGRAPAEVRLADHVSDKQVSSAVRERFEQHFRLPALPESYDIFFYFLELADVPLSLSVIENGEITQQAIDEAKRVGRAYLGSYLPSVLENAQ